MPAPVPETGLLAMPIALGIGGIVATIVMHRLARARTRRPDNNSRSCGRLLVWSSPAYLRHRTGMPFHWDYPELKGFNFSGGTALIPEFISLTFVL